MMSFCSRDIAPDDVVISGIGGIFPESNNMDEFKKNLLNNVNMTETTQSENANLVQSCITHPMASVKYKNNFDVSFFSIPNSQAVGMDPMCYKILENSFEAIVDSGFNPSDLKDTNAAVIVCSDISETEVFLLHKADVFRHNMLGTSRCMLANRVSFWLNTHGGSYSMYAEDAASLQGLEMAATLIKNRQCNSVILAAVLVNQMSNSLCYKDVRCFGDFGKGYARSEACVVMHIQRAEFAKRVYATVVQAQAACYGDRNAGIARPVGEKILQLLENFYNNCGVDARQVDFLETSGIKSYEEAESEAVRKIFLGSRKTPLLIGSVKSNVGHAGPVAAFCSIAKMLVAMETGVIPANIGDTSPTLHFTALEDEKMKVVTENIKWRPGYAAVNSMDWTGNYGHVLLKPNMKEKTRISRDEEKLPRLICMSGRNEEDMISNLHKVKDMPLDVEFVRLIQDVYSQSIMNHNYRGFTIVSSEEDIINVQHFDGSKRPVWFVFPGMGSQWPGMGRCLMQLPVIAHTIEECHRILQPKGVDLINILTTQDPHIFDNILHSFVGITAIQIALVKILKLLNIEPDGIIGHSVGELGCAYADGCLSTEQTILVAYYRGLVSIKTEFIDGRMASIGLGHDAVKHLVPPSIEVACHNSRSNCTISGPANDVLQFVDKMKSQCIFAKEVNVSNIAYHSRYIKSAGPKFIQYLEKIIPEPVARSSRWPCSSSPEDTWDSPDVRYCSAAYQTNNLLNPVYFEEACKHIPQNAILIEIAPRGLLQAILKRSMGENCINIPLTQREDKSGLLFLLSAIGKLYLYGVVPNISALYPSVHYPVSRGTPSLSGLGTWDYSNTWPSVLKPNINTMAGSFSVNVNSLEFRVLKEYVINGHIVLPISALLVTMWKELGNVLLKDSEIPVVFEDIYLLRVMKLHKNDSLKLKFFLLNGTKYFEIYEPTERNLLAKGKIMTVKNVSAEFSEGTKCKLEGGEKLTSHDIYTELEIRGYEYGEQFKRIKEAKVGHRGSSAIVHWSNDWIVCLESLLQLVTLHSAQDTYTLELPVSIKRVVIDPIHALAEDLLKDREVQYNKSTNTVRCQGIEIQGIEFKEVALDKPYNVDVNRMEFYAYKKSLHKNFTDFVTNAIQLSIENGATSLKTLVELILLVNNETNTNFEEQVKGVIEEIKNIKVVITTLTLSDLQNRKETQFASLTLASDSTLTEGVQLLRKDGGFLLAKILPTTELELSQELASIDEQIFEGFRYILLRKSRTINDSAPVIFMPTIESIKSDDSTNEEYCTKCLVMVSNSIDEVKAAIVDLMETNRNDSRRYVFLVGKDSLACSRNKEFYSEQLRLDLRYNIYYNGSWGNLRFDQAHCFPSEPSGNVCDFISKLRVQDLDWSHIGINLGVSCSSEKESSNKLKVLDISGISTDGDLVAYLAHVKSGYLQAATEPYFTWSLPNFWSLEDAATVPFAYSLAYYSLMLKASARPGENIFIFDGHSFVGHAFIAVALEKNLNVSTAVHTEEHKKVLRNKFPQISESNIYNVNDRKLEIKLLEKSRYKGFRIVVSSMVNSYLPVSVNLVSLFGRLLLLCTTEMELSKEFGMASFLKNVALISIIPERMFEMNASWKRRLHELVRNGIWTSVVQPLDRNVFTLEQWNDIRRECHNGDYTKKVLVTGNYYRTSQITQNCTDQQEIFESVTRRFIDRHQSIFVMSDEADNCVSLAECLVSRGCRFIVLCCDYTTVSSRTRRRLIQLASPGNVRIDVLPMDKLRSEDKARRYLQDRTNTAALSAVAIISVKGNREPIEFLQTALCNQEGTQTVLLINCDAVVVGNMRRTMLPVLDLQISTGIEGNKLRKYFDVLEKMPWLCGTKTLYLHEKDIRTKDKSLYSEEHLPLWLPTSADVLDQLGEELTSRTYCSLEEVCTKTPGHLHVNEVQPVYIIAGLQGTAKNCAASLACNLMCPAVAVKIPGATDNLQENVTGILQAIRGMQAEGPYNLVGISWGGVYAIELARQLQAEGENTQVFLIDGAPETNQDIARHLGVGDQLQVNLLMRLLNITSKEVYANLQGLSNWNSRLHRALSQIPDLSETRKHYITYAIKNLYGKVLTVLEYKPKETLVAGKVILFRPLLSDDSYSCGLDKIFKESADVVLVEGDHKSLTGRIEVANAISHLALVNLQWKRNAK